MPEPNGMEVFEELRSNPETASIPIVVLTAMEDELFAESALALGAARYLTKPLKFQELTSAVRQTLIEWAHPRQEKADA